MMMYVNTPLDVWLERHQIQGPCPRCKETTGKPIRIKGMAGVEWDCGAGSFVPTGKEEIAFWERVRQWSSEI